MPRHFQLLTNMAREKRETESKVRRPTTKTAELIACLASLRIIRWFRASLEEVRPNQPTQSATSPPSSSALHGRGTQEVHRTQTLDS